MNLGLKQAVPITLNSSAMIATTATTSVLGAVYWWVAARSFPVAVVGQAGAVISGMTLLGVIATIGFSTALVPRLAGQSSEKGALLMAALAAVGTVGLAVGALWQAAAAFIWPGLALPHGFSDVLLFAAGVCLTATTLVLDQALIALLRGDLQLARNAIFALVKLFALVVASRWLGEGGAAAIYATWALGQLVSVIALAVPIARSCGIRSLSLPRLRSLDGMRKTVLLHHGFNLALAAPSWILPMLVTVMLSRATNAYFYTAWMIAGMVFTGPIALSTVLYAVASKESDSRIRLFGITFALSAAWGAATAVGMLLFGAHILHLFGTQYGRQATPALVVLVLAVFPQAVKLHYVTLTRVEDRLKSGILLVLGGGLLELGLAAVGAKRGGLEGLAAFYVIAVGIESVVLLPPLIRGLLHVASPPVEAGFEPGGARSELGRSVGDL